ncbi:MAG: Hsp20/alpha crystallin family protein [Deltaproteobacteria bacterium]|nr:Hsp20/alpha crystallin family protein [Deltaproteobacteria bacterium]
MNGGGRWAENDKPLLTVSPLIDLVELPEGICLYCNLPGVLPENTDVTVEGNFLYIRAASRLEPIRGKVHALEFSDIFYEGKVLLPAVDTTRVEATLSNGLLRIMMPFARETRPVRIPVVTE